MRTKFARFRPLFFAKFRRNFAQTFSHLLRNIGEISHDSNDISFPRIFETAKFRTSREPVVIMGFKWSNLESAGNSTCIFFLAFEDATHAGNSAADHESAFRNFAEHSENYVRNVAARRNFARHFGELIEISCEKSLCNEISDDISNEVSPRRRNFEGWQDNGAAKFRSRRCENSMTNEISQFFAAFRCFSLIFDEILRISFSLLLINTVV